MIMRTKVLLFTFLCDEFGIRKSVLVGLLFHFTGLGVEDEISRSFCVLISRLAINSHSLAQ